MSLIIQIDTATESASVSIAEYGVVLAALYNDAQKDHASFVQPAIQELLQQLNQSISDIDAVAVSAGPGSYTGLRVGMSAAKGICFALQKPLIALNTLHILACASQLQNNYSPGTFICPMIDARRMEVFTAVYDEKLQTLLEPCALILDENAFTDLPSYQSIIFCGNGSNKWKNICTLPHTQFEETGNIPAAMAVLAHQNFEKSLFADLAYSEPFYIKAFQDKV